MYKPKTKLTAGDFTMIRMIQGGIHVGKSGMWVARYWLKRFKRSERGVRHIAVRYGLKVHRENRKLYRYVTGSI